MTKSVALVTRSPLFTSVGQDIDQSFLDIIRAQNWAFCFRPQTHLSLAVGETGWDDYPAVVCSPVTTALAVPTLNVIAAAGAATFIFTDIWVDEDMAALVTMICGTEVDITTAANTVVVSYRFTGSLGNATVNTAHVQANNDTELAITQVLSAVTNGNEWVSLEIICQRTVGAATTNAVRHCRVSEDEITISTVPDPRDS